MREWANDPQKWLDRPLVERLEILRKEYCTGACGQSSSVSARRWATNQAFLQAIHELKTLKAAGRFIDGVFFKD